MKNIFIIIFILIEISIAHDFKPSFDCKNIKENIVEQYICNKEELSGWDRFMYDVYDFSYKKEENKTQLKNDQLAWIQERNNCKKNYNCIENSYSKRVQILIDKYVEQQAIPDEYIFELFKKYPKINCSTINITSYRTEELNKKHTEAKKKICEEIKETIWNKKSMASLKIRKPIIQAKFFEDKKYRDFIHESIKKVNLPIKKGGFFPPSIFYGRDLMVLNSNDEREGMPIWDSLIKPDMCDIRIYKGEFDGNLENGEEYLHFVGANFLIDYYKLPKKHPGNEALVTLMNLNDKTMKFRKGFMHDATTNCLNYKGTKWLADSDKLKLSEYLSNILIYNDLRILFWKEYIKTKELWLKIVDDRYRDAIKTIMINRKGEVIR